MKLGIDFGTCFSFAAACTGQNGLPNPLVGNNSNIYDNNGGIPTVFYNDTGNKEIMGRRAAVLSNDFPENGVSHLKKDLRDKCPPDKKYTLGGVNYTAKNIVVKFIKFLIDNATEEIIRQYPGENSNLENIVIAVPAMATLSYREFIRECVAGASGLNVKKIELIDEPVAAALCYYATRKDTTIKNGSHVLTYDLGGGTFDTAIVEYSPSNIQKFIVKAQSGDTKTGGTDWGNELLNYIKTETNHTYTKLTNRDEYMLMQAVIDAKIRLSEIDSITFAHFAEDAEINFLVKGLTRKKFEEITKKYLDRTVMVVRDIIDEYIKNRGSNTRIDAIVLSGGASQMPMVKQRLTEEFSKIKICSERPDRAIAFGAAIYAADFGNTQMVAPHTYGTNCSPRNPDGVTFGSPRIFNILFKGTPISVQRDGKYISGKGYYYPIEPNQKTIRFDVYESNEPLGIEWIDFGERKPIFGVTIPVEKVQGIETLNRSFTAEFRLFQGGILELHIYDNNQSNKEVGFERHQL